MSNHDKILKTLQEMEKKEAEKKEKIIQHIALAVKFLALNLCFMLAREYKLAYIAQIEVVKNTVIALGYKTQSKITT